MTAMSPSEFAQLAQALYGERWKAPVARLLNLHRCTVQHFLKGTRAIPDGVAAELRDWVSTKLANVGETP